VFLSIPGDMDEEEVQLLPEMNGKRKKQNEETQAPAKPI
jgi:hypothetical protein